MKVQLCIYLERGRKRVGYCFFKCFTFVQISIYLARGRKLVFAWFLVVKSMFAYRYLSTSRGAGNFHLLNQPVKVLARYSYLSTSGGAGKITCLSFPCKAIFVYLPIYLVRGRKQCYKSFLLWKISCISPNLPLKWPETLVVQEYELLPSLQVYPPIYLARGRELIVCATLICLDSIAL